MVAGDYKTGKPFNPVVFTLYDVWTNLTTGRDDDGPAVQARQAVARGQALFNTKPINIVGVKGLNDDLSVPVLQGSCTTCHDSPNAGNHSIPAPLDIGLTDASRRTPDMPLYQLRNKTTGEVIATTDPGRAMITGKWKDIGRFKGPILRGLASRAPYFHNGFAADLDAVVDFYNQRFGIGLTAQERRGSGGLPADVVIGIPVRGRMASHRPHADLVAVRNILAHFSNSVDLANVRHWPKAVVRIEPPTADRSAISEG